MLGGPFLRLGIPRGRLRIPPGFEWGGQNTGWLATWECPLCTDSASLKSLESFIELISFCNSWILLVRSRIVSRSSINLLLENSSNVNPWNLFNSSISLRLYIRASRRSRFCSNNCSWESCWSRRSCSSRAWMWSISLRWDSKNPLISWILLLSRTAWNSCLWISAWQSARVFSFWRSTRNLICSFSESRLGVHARTSPISHDRQTTTDLTTNFLHQSDRLVFSLLWWRERSTDGVVIDLQVMQVRGRRVAGLLPDEDFSSLWVVEIVKDVGLVTFEKSVVGRRARLLIWRSASGILPRWSPHGRGRGTSPGSDSRRDRWNTRKGTRWGKGREQAIKSQTWMTMRLRRRVHQHLSDAVRCATMIACSLHEEITCEVHLSTPPVGCCRLLSAVNESYCNKRYKKKIELMCSKSFWTCPNSTMNHLRRTGAIFDIGEKEKVLHVLILILGGSGSCIHEFALRAELHADVLILHLTSSLSAPSTPVTLLMIIAAFETVYLANKRALLCKVSRTAPSRGWHSSEPARNSSERMRVRHDSFPSPDTSTTCESQVLRSNYCSNQRRDVRCTSGGELSSKCLSVMECWCVRSERRRHHDQNEFQVNDSKWRVPPQRYPSNLDLQLFARLTFLRPFS